MRLKPTQPMYVLADAPPLTEITEGNVGAFLGMQQACVPDRKWDLVKPVLTMWASGQKAGVEPKQASFVVKFVAAKQIKMGIGQVVRLC